MEQQESPQGSGRKGWNYTPQIVLFFLLLFAGLGWFWWSDSGDWVVKVNGTEISARELDKETDRAFRFYSQVYGLDLKQGADSALSAQLRQQVLNEMINRALLKKAAQRAGLTVPRVEADLYLAEVARRAGGIAEMERILKAQGLTLDEYRQRVRDMLLVRKLEEMVTENVEVSEAEVRMAYESNFSQQVRYEDVREALRQELLAAKKNQVIMRYVGVLRERGRIMYNQKMLRNGLNL